MAKASFFYPRSPSFFLSSPEVSLAYSERSATPSDHVAHRPLNITALLKGDSCGHISSKMKPVNINQKENDGAHCDIFLS